MQHATPFTIVFSIVILLLCVSVLVLPSAWLDKAMNTIGNIIQTSVSWILNLFKRKNNPS